MLGTRSFGSFQSANLTYVLGIEGVISLSDVNLAAASILSGVLIFGLAPYDLVGLVVVLVDLAAYSSALLANARFYTVACTRGVSIESYGKIVDGNAKSRLATEEEVKLVARLEVYGFGSDLCGIIS